MIVLVTFIAFFIVLPLSLVGFEMGRYFLLITQVENVAGACALSGTGAIATIPSTATGGTALQNLYNGCAQEAVYCLQLNSLLSNNMAPNVSAVYNNIYAPYQAPPTPPVGKAAISISFLDQNNKWHKDLTTSGAVKMAVTISYTTKPVFSTPGMLMNLMPTETATASSTGGLPQLDVFLAFDLSGSMDDQTGVCFVNRYWDLSVPGGRVNYDFNANRGPGSPPTPNTIYYQSPAAKLKTPPVGVQLNAIPPQNLSKRDPAIYFNEYTRCDLSASSEQGQLPGGVTYNAGVPQANPITYPGLGTINPTLAGAPNPAWYNPYGTYYAFTDMVVIPSANPLGAAYKVPTNWQQTAVIECEQSRGNLESSTLLLQSQGGAAALAQSTWKTQLTSAAASGLTAQAYWAFAAQNCTPSYQALTAGQNFVSTMNLSTDARFGLCTFADTASSTGNTTTTGSQYLISSLDTPLPAYVPGGTPPGGTYPLPFVSLSAGSPGSFNQAYAGLTPPDSSYNPKTASTQAVPTGQTDMYDALDHAITDVTTNGRATARKAIVLFTDGIPTPSIPNNSNSAIINRAGDCAAPNIPIYTIGLAQGADPALVAQEDSLLKGISDAGGVGGQYFATTSATQLNSAFQAIARSLVLLRSN